MKEKKPLMVWTGYADNAEVQDYLDCCNENAEEGDKITLEQASEMIAQDSDYWTMQWESFCEFLTEEMNGRQFFRDDATGMGWQSRTGYKVFKAENGQKMVDAITPNTQEFSLTVWKHYNGFKIRIGHHDAPMGEIHMVRPITEGAYMAIEG